MTTFAELALRAPVLETLAAQHYVSPTPIQAQAIPHILSGRDLLGIAQTGSGKTAAFALPILQLLAGNGRRAPRGCRALVLAPTRELASQINQSFRVYGRGHDLSSTVIFGGVAAGPQIRALAAGVDIVVATPGRLIDHLDQGNVRLQNSKILVLDEVDRMLDMGFIQPVRRIVRASPSERQPLLAARGGVSRRANRVIHVESRPFRSGRARVLVATDIAARGFGMASPAPAAAVSPLAGSRIAFWMFGASRVRRSRRLTKLRVTSSALSLRPFSPQVGSCANLVLSLGFQQNQAIRGRRNPGQVRKCDWLSEGSENVLSRSRLLEVFYAVGAILTRMRFTRPGVWDARAPSVVL